MFYVAGIAEERRELVLWFRRGFWCSSQSIQDTRLEKQEKPHKFVQLNKRLKNSVNFIILKQLRIKNNNFI